MVWVPSTTNRPRFHHQPFLESVNRKTDSSPRLSNLPDRSYESARFGSNARRSACMPFARLTDFWIWKKHSHSRSFTVYTLYALVRNSRIQHSSENRTHLCSRTIITQSLLERTCQTIVRDQTIVRERTLHRDSLHDIYHLIRPLTWGRCSVSFVFIARCCDLEHHLISPFVRSDHTSFKIHSIPTVRSKCDVLDP